MKTYQILFLFLLLNVPITLFSQSKSIQSKAALQEVAANQLDENLKTRLDKIDRMLNASIERGDVPGLAVLIAKDGKIIYHTAKGKADVASGKNMEKDAIFRIASQTKAITSTAVMILWEEGHFRLDDPISKWIPEFKNPKVLQQFKYADTSYTSVAANKEITIRHLLTHTSGLGYGMIDGDERMKMIYQKAGIVDLYTTENTSIEENIKRLATLPLHHHPGEKFTYSEGLDVLGYFVEIISGKPFDKFLKERIFDPLGMEDTWFYLPENKQDRLVTVHKKENGKWLRYSGTYYDADYPKTGAKRFFSGGAGLSSTAKDYALFLQMYLNQGELNGKRILSPLTVQTIMANQIGDLWSGAKHYGLAFGVVTSTGVAEGGIGSEGTFDWGGYFNTQYFADPESKIIGILMKQTRDSPNEDTGWKFRQMVFSLVD
ncbi:MAG: class A beta-lactamase-related serine hydrolase [Mongoliibacter sp.]|uniref:serine hydrolase domain-containing protein n=1 Tax=Mongoliibacter sp. TaxID=2022438 RepID=UPI0012F1F2F1|nr:serine hydrolase domain-containing protein [Mongoliibacter sp.]TVP52570.1 MAG: class A beta-lactamase-related serine hydrolase [Mongoliibacter sp.]